MAKIIVDNQVYEVKDGQNLLSAVLSVGLDLPYFCWHPAMGSVGACRQCAVKQFRDDNDTQGKLVMACMTPAAEGTRISIDDKDARDFRVSVAEWLVLNHPHDCPICDEGGECHLQDMIVMTGHVYRRTAGRKRTFRNQALGPLVNHEMNRCIQCYRCVRFYRDYADGKDFAAFGNRNHVYFGRARDGILESEFSGNLVEICPTGVFNDKTQKEHYSRKWDLQTAPSICVHCGVGCNTIPGQRYGMLRRVRNRYNGQVNGYFLCDRGRYGYEFVNSERRMRQVSLRPTGDAEAAVASKEDALKQAASLLAGEAGVIGIGSPRASLEANFALLTLVGGDRFFAGVSENDHRLASMSLNIQQKGPARSPSLADVGQCDAALVLGEDVTQTAPMLALALRQSTRRQPLRRATKLQIAEWDDAGVRNAIQQERGPLFIATAQATRLDDVATKTHRAAPDDVARLGFAVAQALDPQATAVAGLPDEVAGLAKEIAAALKEAERPVVVSGAGCGSESVLRAAANVAWALRRSGRSAELCLATPECNSLGLALMGGGSLEGAFETVRSGGASTVIILENDLYRRADRAAVDAFFDAAKQVIVIDHTQSATTSRADVLLPAATFAEADGTLVNNEGRAQRFYSVLAPCDDIQESWRWLRDLMVAAGRSDVERWQTLDDIVGDVAAMAPVFAPVTSVAPPASFRIEGLKVARQPSRFSGRTAMFANISVHEPRPPQDPDSALSFSMEGYQGQQPPSALIPRIWAPGWNSEQALNKFQDEIGGPLRGGDPGCRLIEPTGDGAPYFAEVPPAFEPSAGRWLVVPARHIFGSEELSAPAPGIAGLAPQPYIALNPDDAAALGVAEAAEVEIAAGERSQRLSVKLMSTLPAGVAAVPVGLPGVEWVGLPAWCTLKN
ncbi:MAG: NADH-quinone oxidoreductase subunit NuoG, partial [Dehalococcoidia bacterium]